MLDNSLSPIFVLRYDGPISVYRRVKMSLLSEGTPRRRGRQPRGLRPESDRKSACATPPGKPASPAGHRPTPSPATSPARGAPAAARDAVASALATHYTVRCMNRVLQKKTHTYLLSSYLIAYVKPGL